MAESTEITDLLEKEKSDADKDTRVQTPLDKKRSLRPILKDQYHQDSLFGNSFQSKSFFIVHPEWLSEAVDNRDPEPLHRPPWPWEQPRYRQNIQIPITYTPVEEEETKEKEAAPTSTGEMPTSYGENGVPEAVAFAVPLGLPLGYTFTQPGIDLTKPFEKQTQFGAPLVDTTSYKLSY